MNFRRLNVLLMIVLCLGLMVAVNANFVSASTIIASNPTRSSFEVISSVHPAAGGSGLSSAGSMSFQVANDRYLYSISVNFGCSASIPTDAIIKMRLYEVANSSADISTGTFLELSTTDFYVSGAQIDWTWVDFDFNGSLLLDNAKWYAFEVYVSSATLIGGSNYYMLSYSSSTATGYSYIYYQGAWVYSATHDINYIVYGSSEPVPSSDSNDLTYVSYLNGDSFSNYNVSLMGFPVEVQLKQSAVDLYTQSFAFTNTSMSGTYRVFESTPKTGYMASYYADEVLASNGSIVAGAFSKVIDHITAATGSIFQTYRYEITPDGQAAFNLTYVYGFYKLGASDIYGTIPFPIPLDPTSFSPTPAPSIPLTDGGGFLSNDLVMFMMALMYVFVPPMLVLVAVPKVGMAGFMVVLTGCAALGVFYLGLPFYFLIFAALGIGIMFYGVMRRS